MLARLNECIKFLESKPNYKESFNYLKQFKNLQIQTLQFIKSHIINTIQTTTNEIMPASGETLAAGESVFTLFYGKFQNNADRVKSLAVLIEEHQSNAL